MTPQRDEDSLAWPELRDPARCQLWLSRLLWLEKWGSKALRRRCDRRADLCCTRERSSQGHQYFYAGPRQLAGLQRSGTHIECSLSDELCHKTLHSHKTIARGRRSWRTFGVVRLVAPSCHRACSRSDSSLDGRRLKREVTGLRPRADRAE